MQSLVVSLLLVLPAFAQSFNDPTAPCLKGVCAHQKTTTTNNTATVSSIVIVRGLVLLASFLDS